MSNDSEESAGSSSTSSSAEVKGSNSSHSGSSVQSSSVNGGKSSRGPGRPKKVPVTSPGLKACTWCADNKVPLKYIINQNRSRKEFCSENCVAEFRNAYRKGACAVCDNVIRENAPHRDYCSTFCLNSAADTMKGDQQAGTGLAREPPSSAGTVTSSSSSSNNNNTTAENLNESSGGQRTPTPKTPSSTGKDDRLSPYAGRTGGGGGGGGGGGIFQYEQLNVFDWTVYLKVSAFVFIK